MTALPQMSILVGLTIAGVFYTCATLDAQQPQPQQRPEPRDFHSQTQGGVTVRIELVTVERIFNEPAWLEAKGKELKIDEATAEFLRRRLPPKEVTLFVSVVGDTKMLGPTKVTFADQQESKISSSRFFSPPKWQPRLPQLAVDPRASGIETHLAVSDATRVADLFPAQIQVQVTTAQDKELTFVFENVEF